MMKHILATLCAGFLFSGGSVMAQVGETVRIYDGVVFYDGYRMENNPDKDLDDGVLRHSCSLYSVKLTDEQISKLGSSLEMKVYITACCDNYDRIGNINLAFVPKGASAYRTDEVDRIEIARFITPFMDKNKQPDTVPYSYWLDYLGPILHDVDLNARYDFWLEFELFGIPYAANQQIAGCKDRSDVFKGTLEFETITPAMEPTHGNVIVPIVIKKPEYIGNNLNNYNEDATDIIGKTEKTYTFEVPVDVTGGQIVLITSNHGANENGEEYNRRQHQVRIDRRLALVYTPGRDSCEPFRQYNTQLNGIYGYSAMSDEEWQSFSNWCPGDVIDNRIIDMGDVSAGTHTIKISVPQARFFGKQGDIPVSIYFHGAADGVGNAGLKKVGSPRSKADVTISGGVVSVTTDREVADIDVTDTDGIVVASCQGNRQLSMSESHMGLYLVNVRFADGIVETHKVFKK